MREISIIRLEIASMGMRHIRNANLPPGSPEGTLRITLASNGEIVSIHDEMWSKAYHYTMASGIKLFMMKMTRHFPSHTNIAGHSILASCDAQPVTCYRRGDTVTYVPGMPQKARKRNRVTRPALPHKGPYHCTGAHNRSGTKDSRTEVIHKGVPTDHTLVYDRLANIQRSETNQCPHCSQPNNLMHRLNECSEGTDI